MALSGIPCIGRHAGMTEMCAQPWTAGLAKGSVRRNYQTGAFREDLMKHWLIGLLLLAGTPALAQQAFTEQALAQQAVPSIDFDSIPNPLRLPTNMYFGEVSGVSVNSRGHIFVLSRGNTSGPAYA